MERSLSPSTPSSFGLRAWVWFSLHALGSQAGCVCQLLLWGWPHTAPGQPLPEVLLPWRVPSASQIGHLMIKIEGGVPLLRAQEPRGAGGSLYGPFQKHQTLPGAALGSEPPLGAHLGQRGWQQRSSPGGTKCGPQRAKNELRLWLRVSQHQNPPVVLQLA